MESPTKAVSTGKSLTKLVYMISDVRALLVPVLIICPLCLIAGKLLFELLLRLCTDVIGIRLSHTFRIHALIWKNKEWVLTYILSKPPRLELFNDITFIYGHKAPPQARPAAITRQHPFPFITPFLSSLLSFHRSFSFHHSFHHSFHLSNHHPRLLSLFPSRGNFWNILFGFTFKVIHAYPREMGGSGWASLCCHLTGQHTHKHVTWPDGGGKRKFHFVI